MNGVFNIAKGRVGEFYNRVKSNDPANSALVLCLFTGAGTDATLRDLDTLAAIEADAGFAEVVHASYARKVLTDSDLAALPAPDDANDKYVLDLPNQIWLALAGGASITRLIVGYDPDTTAGTDANIIPLTFHDFVTTASGADVTANFNANWFEATEP
jgi:hypothetical protein